MMMSTMMIIIKVILVIKFQLAFTGFFHKRFSSKRERERGGDSRKRCTG